MRLGSKIAASILFGGILIGTSYVGMKIGRKIGALNKVNYILNINRDGELDSEEIKRFYDETGTTPYTEQVLENMPSKDLQKFLDLYK